MWLLTEVRERPKQENNMLFSHSIPGVCVCFSSAITPVMKSYGDLSELIKGLNFAQLTFSWSNLCVSPKVKRRIKPWIWQACPAQLRLLRVCVRKMSFLRTQTHNHRNIYIYIFRAVCTSVGCVWWTLIDESEISLRDVRTHKQMTP